MVTHNLVPCRRDYSNIRPCLKSTSVGRSKLSVTPSKAYRLDSLTILAMSITHISHTHEVATGWCHHHPLNHKFLIWVSGVHMFPPHRSKRWSHRVTFRNSVRQRIPRLLPLYTDWY